MKKELMFNYCETMVHQVLRMFNKSIFVLNNTDKVSYWITEKVFIRCSLVLPSLKS